MNHVRVQRTPAFPITQLPTYSITQFTRSVKSAGTSVFARPQGPRLAQRAASKYAAGFSERMRFMRRFFFSLLLLCCTLPALAQTQPSSPLKEYIRTDAPV